MRTIRCARRHETENHRMTAMQVPPTKLNTVTRRDRFGGRPFA